MRVERSESLDRAEASPTIEPVMARRFSWRVNPRAERDTWPRARIRIRLVPAKEPSVRLVETKPRTMVGSASVWVPWGDEWKTASRRATWRSGQR